MRSRDFWGMQKDPIVDKLDLTKLTRYSKHFITSINVKQLYGQSREWITCGAISVNRNDKTGPWTVRCRMDGARDFEHDSASAFCMDLIGVEFEFMDSGVTYMRGWIRSDSPEGFLVPPADYNPLKGAIKCKECKGRDAHVIVDEGFYVPQVNVELWEKVRGCVVDIRTGPYDKEDLDE